MSTCSSVSYSSDSDEDIDIEAESPKRPKVMTKKVKKQFGAHHVNLLYSEITPTGISIYFKCY